MDIWVTAGELAGLPFSDSETWPSSERRCRERAEKLGITRRKGNATTLGGRRPWEYHLTSLPTATQTAIRQRKQATDDSAAQAGREDGQKARLIEELDEKSRATRKETAAARVVTLSDTARRRMDAKLAIFEAVQQCIHTATVGTTQATEQCCLAYNSGELLVEPWVRDLVPDLSAPTFRRWCRSLAEAGSASLAGAYGNRTGTGQLDRQLELASYLVSLIVTHPQTTVANLYKGLVARFWERADVAIPSRRTVERWVHDWKAENGSLYHAVTNPDAWKSRYMAAFGSASEEVNALNQRWEIDSTPADLLLADGRHALIGVIDVYSVSFRQRCVGIDIFV